MSAEQLAQVTTHFLQGQYEQGLILAKQCLKKTASPPLLLNKAMFEYRLGNTQQAISDVGQVLILDPLNHHAYFNLFSIYYQQAKWQNAFKNICCALSVVHLILAQSLKSQEHVEKSVQYSFNNKQARALKSILKLSANRNIQALNQINYALYLDPSNQNLLTIQKKVYKKMGMKELKNQNNTQKPKFDRLDTCKEVPSEDLIQKNIQELVQQFNTLMKKIPQNEVYFVSLQKQNEKSLEEIKEEPSIRWASIKKISDKQSDEQTEGTESRSRDDESERSQTSNNFNQCSLQQELLINTSQSFSKMDSISISNISQNSRVRLSRVNNKNVLDISQCVISLLEESGSNRILPEDSLDSMGESQRVELKLPMDSIRGLGENEKFVLAIQRVKTNEKGEKEQMEELYEIVANNRGMELVKSEGVKMN